MGDTWSTADKVCMLWERRSAFVLLIVSALWLAYVFQYRIMFSIALMLGIVTLAMAVWYKPYQKWKLCTRFQFGRHRQLITTDIEASEAANKAATWHDGGILLDVRRGARHNCQCQHGNTAHLDTWGTSGDPQPEAVSYTHLTLPTKA